MASEKLLERKLREAVEDCGGRCYKLSSMLHTGMPDRLVLLPGGKAVFVEVKTTGKKQTQMQKHVMAGIADLNFETHVLDNEEQLAKLKSQWYLHLTTISNTP